MVVKKHFLNQDHRLYYGVNSKFYALFTMLNTKHSTQALFQFQSVC